MYRMMSSVMKGRFTDRLYALLLVLGVTFAQMSVSCGLNTQRSPAAQRDGPMWHQSLMPRLDWRKQGDAGSPNNIGSGKQIATYLCPAGGIHVTINPGIDKISKLAVMGHENTPGCSSYVMNSMYHLKINITNPANPPCGIQIDVDGTVTAIVATQAYVNAYGGTDRKYTIQCKLGQKLTAQTTGTVIDGALQAGMAFQQDSSMVKLEIRDISATKQLSQAALGDMVVLYAKLMNTIVYKGMDVSRCMAYDSINKNGAHMMLLESGCGTGDLIGLGKGFYHLPGFEDNVIVSTPVPMFRFLKSPFVMVECEFDQLCTSENKAHCDQSCKRGGISRRKRSHSHHVNSTVATLLVVPAGENDQPRYEYAESSSGCVSQMAVILTVVVLGGLVLLSTGAAVWFCTRYLMIRREQSK